MNEEIVGGLKSALERGEPIKRAMMSFFNAGYKKEEIEEAAKFLNSNPAGIIAHASPAVAQAPSPNLTQKEIPSPPAQAPFQSSSQVVSSYPAISNQQIQSAPIVSNYEKTEKKEPKDKVMIIILITALVFLLGLLASIFLFKSEIINFFSNFLG
jgi:hypothetical protein